VGASVVNNSEGSLVERWTGTGLVRVADGGGGYQPGGVSCVSPMDCVAASLNETGQFNGKTWEQLSYLQVVDANFVTGAGISCVDSTYCIAVSADLSVVNPTTTATTLINLYT
jgi:hypothetical protein